MTQKNFPYDAIYKTIFSEKRLVKSLLLDFVKLPFVADFDFSTLELFPANYVTPAFTRHANDLVWRVAMNDHAIFIFIMLEFQSRSEKWMAARIANYTNLLLNKLIVQPQPDVDLENGLPPLLPIVVYNGDLKWHAAKNLSALFMPMPKALSLYQPNQRYFLLDIKHAESRLIKSARGEAGFFVRLERSKSTKETMAILKDVIAACAAPEYDRFRRLLGNFVRCCLKRDGWSDDLDKPMPIEELISMYDNYPRWATIEREKGVEKGLEEGLKKGRVEERAAIFHELLSSLKIKLAERFGNLPQTWIVALSSLSDPARIIDLTSAAYTVGSAEEFENRLLGAMRK